MLFIGDIHGWFVNYKHIIKTADCSFQVGDLGIFNQKDFEDIPEYKEHRFIRGNHDNPELCQKHPNHLGNFGYFARQDIFFVAGADSIDKMYRTPGVSWWPEEELNKKQFEEATKWYLKYKPSLMVTHDCPDLIKKDVFQLEHILVSKTGQYFDFMFQEHQPKMWIFGHMHESKRQTVKDCEFICLNEFETLNIPELTW